MIKNLEDALAQLAVKNTKLAEANSKLAGAGMIDAKSKAVEFSQSASEHSHEVTRMLFDVVQVFSLQQQRIAELENRLGIRHG